MDNQLFSQFNKGAIQAWLPTITGVIIVILIGGGISAYQYWWIPKEEIKVLEEKNETANWNIYQDEKYGFEIKYPQDWRGHINYFADEPSMIFCSPEFFSENNEGWLTFSGSEKGCASGRRIWAQDDGTILIEGIGKVSGEAYAKEWKEKLNKPIRNIHLFIYSSEEETRTDVYLGEKNGLHYYLLAPPEYGEIFNKMFATFKFIEKEDGWTKSVTSEASGVEWSGVITSINATEKTIKATRMPGGLPRITVFLLDDTVIKDKSNNILSLSNLKLGDVVSIFGEYQMRGKYTDNWDVRMSKTEEVIFLGECIKEGKEIIQDLQCCTDFILIEGKYCTKCGDSICKAPENKENCLLDCAEINKPITISIFIDVDSFDLVNKTFEGTSQIEKQKIKILTTDSTKFYSQPTWPAEGETFTFPEFYSLLKNWTGPIWLFQVKGILEKEDTIKAEEVFYFIQ